MEGIAATTAGVLVVPRPARIGAHPQSPGGWSRTNTRQFPQSPGGWSRTNTRQILIRPLRGHPQTPGGWSRTNTRHVLPRWGRLQRWRATLRRRVARRGSGVRGPRYPPSRAIRAPHPPPAESPSPKGKATMPLRGTLRMPPQAVQKPSSWGEGYVRSSSRTSPPASGGGPKGRMRWPRCPVPRKKKAPLAEGFPADTVH